MKKIKNFFIFKCIFHILPFLILLSLGGCGSLDETIISDMEHQYEYQTVGDNNDFQKILSLTGMLQIPNRGDVYQFNPVEGIDSSLAFVQGETSFVTQMIGSDVTLQEVQDVAQKVLQSKQAGTKVFSEKINYIKAEKNNSLIDKTPFFSAYQAARETFDTAYQNLLNALKPGILVLEFNDSQRSTGSLSALVKASFNYKSNNQHTGTLVLGGLKITNLLVGKDFCGRIAHSLSRFKRSKDNSYPFLTPLYLIQAKHIIFMQSSKSNLENEEDIQSTIIHALQQEGLTDLEIAELKLINKRMKSIQGLTFISATKNNIRKIPFPGYINDAFLRDDSGWTTIYAILSPFSVVYNRAKQWCNA